MNQKLSAVVKPLQACFFLITLSPLSAFSAPLCASMPGAASACQVDNNNGGGNKMVCASIAPPASISISLADYATVINRAIHNLSLNSTPIGIPACIAEAGTNWSPLIPSTKNTYSIRVALNVQNRVSNPNTLFPNAGNEVMQIPGTGGYYLGGTVAYCPCGSYPGSCNSNLVSIPFNTSGLSIHYNNANFPNFNLGYCGNGQEGGFMLNVYSPAGQIPAIGTYTATLEISATSIAGG